MALQTVHDDLLHHGEIRGVEIKLTEMSVTQVDASTLLIAGELGVSDGEATLSFDVEFNVTV